MFKIMFSKRVILFAAFSAFTLGAYAQLSTQNGTVTNSGNNNVGVGTNTPSSKLEVKSSGATGVLQLNFSGGPGAAGPFGEPGPLVFPSHVFKITDLTYTPNSTKFLIDRYGKTLVGDFSGITTSSFLSTRSSFSVFNNNSNSAGISYVSDAPFLKWNTSNNSNFTFSNSTMDVMSLTNTGNVGIGISNPTSKLEIKDGDVKIDGGNLILTDGDLQLLNNNLNLASGDLSVNGKLSVNFTTEDAYAIASMIKVNRDDTTAFYIESNSSGAPKSIFKVWGNGVVNMRKVYADEVEVRLNHMDTINWPDYVFKKGYDLMSLKEVRKHINEKGHLPNVPSEKEVMKNGINLGQMDAILLRKVEELTLYVLELHKENESLKLEVQKIKKQQK